MKKRANRGSLSPKTSCLAALASSCRRAAAVSRLPRRWGDCRPPRGRTCVLFCGGDAQVANVVPGGCGRYILQLSESQDYICSAGIVFMLLSWKDGEIVAEIKPNLFHNIPASCEPRCGSIFTSATWGESRTLSIK